VTHGIINESITPQDQSPSKASLGPLARKGSVDALEPRRHNASHQTSLAIDDSQKYRSVLMNPYNLSFGDNPSLFGQSNTEMVSHGHARQGQDRGLVDLSGFMSDEKLALNTEQKLAFELRDIKQNA
jgi:hypothetical protein